MLLLEDLKKQAKEDGLDSSYTYKIESLLKESKGLTSVELSKNKTDIINKINEEIALRLFGKDARIKESLKHDKQINTAVSVLNNSKVFNSLLVVK